MLFEYKAKKMTGEETSGTMEAAGKNELAHKLREMGFVPILAREKGKERQRDSFLSKIGFISAADKIMFSRNLSVMMAAGLPVTRALEILSRQTANKIFSRAIVALMDEARKGNPLSEAMKSYPKIFSKLFVAMVKTGEESGQLSGALDVAGQQIEKDHSLVKRIRGAMMYPSIIVAAMILIGIFMFIYVVPTLVATFSGLKMKLPLSTRVIIFISDVIAGHFYLFIIGLFAAVFALIWFIRTEIGRMFLSNILLRIPLISSVVKKINSARTSRTLAAMISSGVNIVEALTITRDVLQNGKYKKVLDLAIGDVQKGVPISSAFKNASGLYPVLLGEMIAVGEETGKISEMLGRLADFYEEEVAEATKNLTTIIEPILMIFIGAAVGLFAFSMISPMYSMMNGV